MNTWNVNPVYDSKLRRNQLLVKKGAVLQIQHDYGYDNASRLQQVYQGSYTANYTYEANSSLIDKVDYKYSTTTRLTGDRTHDKLNRLTVMANTPQSGLPVSFAYQYNDANQRIRTVLADGSYWLYEYDQRGQVIRGRRFWADHTPVAGQQFDFAFDDIGNRQNTLTGGDQTGGNQRSASYNADKLNRYSSRTVPGGFDVLGVATATSAVTVNSQSTHRKGEYFWKQVDGVNTSVPVWQNNTVTVSGGSTTTGNVWVPQTPEAYTYDNDGNTLTDGRWTYTWDAENRLTRLVARTAVGPQQRLDFEYDHMGRRIRKTVYNNTAGTPPAATDLKSIYDGWNLIAEVSSADALVRQYMWGTDLSGTAQGAGGVGGLVKIYDHASSKTYFPGYDGNGNVAVLVDGDTGAAGAVYEYGPFGELIRSSGTYAAANPFRFSTKYRDAETDFLYYGFRYLNTSTGRWLSRDPIGERGGGNLLDLAENDAVNRIDVDGRFYVWVHQAITEDALAIFVRKNPLNRPCVRSIEIFLDNAAVEQDAHGFDDLRRHYNRKIGNLVSDKVTADQAFAFYLAEETAAFSVSLFRGKCKEALFSLGLLAHSWQDFFAHAVRRDGQGGSEDSNHGGWTAFSVGIRGSPEERSAFWPSSYSLDGDGEHPPKHEPVAAHTAEGLARKREALIFTHKKLSIHLSDWLAHCKCVCEKGDLFK